MKRFGVVRRAFLLFVFLGATAFGYAQQEQQSEKQTNQEKQAKPEQQHAQPQQQHAQQPQQKQNKQQVQPPHVVQQPQPPQQNQNKQQAKPPEKVFQPPEQIRHPKPVQPPDSNPPPPRSGDEYQQIMAYPVFMAIAPQRPTFDHLTLDRRTVERQVWHNVVRWHCRDCDWAVLTFVGVPGEITEDLAQAMFLEHTCNSH
jgi:hypothetical protein